MFAALCKRTSPIICKNRYIGYSWTSYAANYTSLSDQKEESNESETIDPPNEKKSKKILPVPQDYVILGARKSGLLPRHRPQISTSFGAVGSMEEQRKNLEKVFLAKPQDELLFKVIDGMKPLNTEVSQKRYNQILRELWAGFSKEQIRQYFIHKAPPGTVLKATATKKATAKRILTTIWNMKISSKVSESSDVVVEKTIPLTKRELFLLLVNEQQLPRSWTKGGARIVISFDDPKIVVNSTADTYDWIQATIHNALQSTSTVNIDITGLEKFESLDKLPLDRIQRISKTYLKKEAQRLKANSSKPRNIEIAKRMLAQALGFSSRENTDFFYSGTSRENRLSQIVDDDALSWIDRALVWCRLKRAQKKNQQIVKSMDDIDPEIINRLCTDLKNTKCESSGRPTALTATFGYLLHNVEPEKPDIDLEGTRRIFSSNIPLLYSRTSRLSLFDSEADTAYETETEIKTEEPEKETATDAWQRLLDITLNQAKENTSEKLVHSSKKRPNRDDHAYLVQLKLVPDIFDSDGAENLRKYPPIELWFELDNTDRYVESSINFASAEEEISRVVSLPSWESDIKFTTSISSFLDSSQPSVQEFLKKINISVHGDVPIHIPEHLTVDMDGKKVQYIYQSMTYRRQIDLEYKGYILQLSTLEGGGHGGRKIEANLVLHFPDGTEQLEEDEVRKFVNEAFAYAQSITGKQPTIL